MFSLIKQASLLLLMMQGSFLMGQIDPFIGIIDADSCDFSSSCSYLTLSNNDLWQKGIATKNTLQSNEIVLITDTLVPYPSNASNAFEIHWPVYTHSFFNFILSFEHSMHTPAYEDGGKIEISYDYGQNWLSIEDDYNSNIAVHKENFYGPFDTLFDGSQGFSGEFNNRHSAIQWVWILPLKDMPTDTMYYRFHFVSDSNNQNMDGWMIHQLKFSYAEIDGGINEEIQQMNLFHVQTQSAENHLEIETDIQEFTLFLYNHLGQCLATTTNEKSLNVSGIPQGIYWIKFRTSSGLEQTSKVLLN